MRSNFRLDWRALALLGALLTIMIKWPGEAGGMGLVQAMPTTSRDFLMEQTPTTRHMEKMFNMKRNATVENSYNNHVHNGSNKNEKHLLLSSSSSSSSSSTSADFVISDDTSLMSSIDETTKSMSITSTKPQVKDNNSDSDNNNNKKTQNIEGGVNHHSSSQIISMQRTTSPSPISSSATLMQDSNDGALKLLNFESNKNTNFMSNRRKRIKINNMQAKDGVAELAKYQSMEKNHSISNELIRNSHEMVDNKSILNGSDNRQVGADKTTKMTSLATVADNEQFELSSFNDNITTLSRTERSLQEAVGSDSIVRRSPHVTHGSNVGGLKSRRLNISRNLHNKRQQTAKSNLDRNERSTISHLTGPSRKIQLFIKNRYLQLLPDGTINGTQDDSSDYTILQRSTVDIGRIKIQSVATCLYLCMDSCGAVFSSIDFTDDCIFNENMEQHNYNTYSSTYNSNARRTNYLALNRHGEPRKLQIPTTRSLGKLATYTNAITETVVQDRVEQLIAKNFGANRVKHGIRQLCDIGKPLVELIDRNHFKARPMCNANNNSSSNSSNNSSSSSSSIINTINSSTNSNSSFSNSIRNSQLTHNVPAANDNHNNNSNKNVNSKNNSHDEQTNIYHHNFHHHIQQNSSSSNNSSRNLNVSSNSGDSYKYDNQSTISSSNVSSSSTISSKYMEILSSNSSSSISNRSESSSGHISNRTTSVGGIGLANQHHSSGSNHQHRPHHQPKRRKRRKCRPYENEEEHNCHKGPQALRKRGNLNKNNHNQNNNKNKKQKLPKCKHLRKAEALITCAGAKSKNNTNHQLGAKRNHPTHSKKLNNTHNSSNAGGAEGRRGKKPNQSLSQLGGPGHRKTGGKNNKNKRKNNQNKANSNKKPKWKKLEELTNDLKNLTSSTTLRSVAVWSTTTQFTGLESTTIYEGPESLNLESTTAYVDRGEREQRNVQITNSLEATAIDSSEDIEDNSEEYSTSGEIDQNNSKEQNDNENEAENENVNMNDNENDDDKADPVAEKDSSSYEEQAQFTGGTDDFMYYDQLDFARMALWQLIALLWILPWFLHIL